MFLEALKKKNYSSVSFTGMAKNVGKTTSLNYLLKECYLDNYPVGLASIGRDGEKKDTITGMDKPGIWVANNTIVAAAETAIKNSSASLEILEDTGFTSALGQIYLTKVRRPGYVEVATTPSSQKMYKIIKMMKNAGAKLVLVDGALDRVSFAAPDITDCTILSTGAALHPRIEVVVSKTAARVQQLTAPLLTQYNTVLSQKTIDLIKTSKSSMAIIGNDEYPLIIDKFPLEHEKTLLPLLNKQKLLAIYINGAVVDGLLNFIIANRKILSKTVVIADKGTNIIVNHEVWNKFQKAHGIIRVLKQVNLLAVTCNPISANGEVFSIELLLDMLAEKIKDITIVDVMTNMQCRYSSNNCSSIVINTAPWR